MKHLQTYENFEHIDEKWRERDTRFLLNSPLFIAAFVGRLMGIYPLLNFKWKEIKKKTKDSKFDPLVARGGRSTSTINSNLKKITLDDIPDSRLKIPMFLRGWNLYLYEREVPLTGENKGRKSVYITKDELKVGDRYIGERISDLDIYKGWTGFQNMSNEKKIEFPMVIMVAKFDAVEEVKEIEDYVHDICLDLEDDFGVKAEPHINLQKDSLLVEIYHPDTSRNVGNTTVGLIFTEDLSSNIEGIAKRIVEYFRLEGKKGFKYEVEYRIKGNFWYYGDPDFKGKGRFEEIFDKVSKYDQDNDSKITRYTPCQSIEVDRIPSHLVKIGADDIKTLLNDFENCSKSGSRAYHNGELHQNTSDIKWQERRQIELSKIVITIKK